MKKTLANRLTLPVFLLSWAWFVVHFGLLAIYLAPMGEFKAELSPVLASYTGRYFSQGWALFAPDPDGSSKHVQVACKLERGDGTTVDTPFYDVSERFYSKTWQTRLGPNHRLQRAYMAPIYVVGGARHGFELLEYRAKRDPASAELLAKKRVEAAENAWQAATRMATRSASMECKRQFPDAQITQVNAVVDLVQAPPFHTRHSGGTQKSRRLDFGWQPFESTARVLSSRIL
jgi:hypothetical protein